ncbi:MAG: DUF4149 domain-containing protein [Hydrogenobacter sp.]
MPKFLLFLNSLYLGLGMFFSFYVAPVLFKVLQKEQAGRVVEKVFPVYFGIGLVVSLLSLMLGFRLSKWLTLLWILNVLILAFQEFYVIPHSRELKLTDYQAFMKLHGISVTLNLIHLLSVLILCVVLIKL